VRVEALLVAQAEAGFDLAVDDFEFPTLPRPRQERFQREGQPPLTVLALHGIHQIENRLAPPLAFVGVPSLPAHANEHKWGLRHFLAQKRTLDPRHHPPFLSPDGQCDRLPTVGLGEVVLWCGGALTILAPPSASAIRGRQVFQHPVLGGARQHHGLVRHAGPEGRTVVAAIHQTQQQHQRVKGRHRLAHPRQGGHARLRLDLRLMGFQHGCLRETRQPAQRDCPTVAPLQRCQPAQVERILVNLIAYRENLVKIAIQEAAKQNLVNYATYPMLDYLGELVDVTRLEAKYSKTTMRFIIPEAQTFDITIPANTQVESKDGRVIFLTDSEIQIKTGNLSSEISSTANLSGIIGNGYLQGEVKNLISTLPYIITAENITETSGGAEEEDNDSLRQRIKTAPEQFSNAGSRGAYKFFTKSSHQSIIDVSVESPTPGVVMIYPLTTDGTPSSEIIELVNKNLNDDRIRPLTDQLIIEAPEKVDFEIIAEITLYKDAVKSDVEPLIQAELQKYSLQMKSKLGKDIVPSQIIAIINSVSGVYRVNPVSPEFKELTNNQWANCTGITITFTGNADE